MGLFFLMNPPQIIKTAPRRLLFAIASSALATTFLLSSASAQIFTPSAEGSYNWSDTVNWNPTVVPDAAGVSVTKDAGGSSNVLVQDVGAGVTVGSLTLSGSAANTWSINAVNTVNLNNSGSGASINRTAASAGARLDFTPQVGALNLADNLTITNDGGTSSAGSILLRNVLTGTGNITINNSSNDIAAGRIRIEATNTFVGSVTVERGAVSFNNASSFGGASNAILLGTTGAATLLHNRSIALTLTNNIDVGASGATIGASNASDSTFSGVISGAGSTLISGTGLTQFTGVNTNAGNTTINAGSALTLTGPGELRFTLGNSGISNQVLGTGGVTFDGFFRIDAAAASQVGSWSLVNVGTLSESFGPSFGLAFVGGPTFSDDGGGFYTSGDWSFDTGSGVLTAVPEPSVWALVIAGLLGVIVFRRRRQALA